MPDFRPLPQIDREIADLRIARANGSAPFGSARRLVELEEERATVAAVACKRCGGTAVYSGPLSLERRGPQAKQAAFEDRAPCRGCRGTGARSHRQERLSRCAFL